MLKLAFSELSPRIAALYSSFLDGVLISDDRLLQLDNFYREYTIRDANFPRPILTFFGYFYREKEVSFDTLGEIGSVLFISQLLRDFLAIHDDVVDEDIIKFSFPTLPVLFSSAQFDMSAYKQTTLNKQGKDFALFYSDLLVAVIFKTLEDAPGDRLKPLLKLVNETILLTQSGQIRELLLQKRNVESLEIDELVDMYTLKAAHYCYSFPFEAGLVLAGADAELISRSRQLLLRLGAASQIVDDVVGVFPELFDHAHTGP